MDEHHSIDALLPRQIAEKAEDVGVAKARLDATSTFLLAVLAGAFVALGAIFSTVAVTGAADALPYGAARVLAGATFSLGLVLVIVGGAELFTGNNLLVMAHASGRISTGALLRNWGIVYLGNLVGAVATAAMMALAGLHELGGGAVGETAASIARAKTELSFMEAFVRGIYCNALVCLAVWLCMSCRGTGEKILAIVLPITAFVAAGFEHSVANMYFVPAAIFAEAWAGSAGPAPDWGAFLLRNLLPVTLGNIVGGGVLVGAVYWLIYRRPGRG